MNQEVNQPVKPKPRFFYGYVVVVAASSIRMVMVGPRSAFGVFFKPLIAEFGWSRALISGAFSVHSVMQGLSGTVMGGLNDRFGPRVVMTFCGFLVGLTCLLMSQISASWQLYLFYLVMGIGMGGSFPPTMSTVARWFAKRRSVMTGFVLAGGGIGGMIAPPVANWLISTYGWRNAYIIMGALVLVLAILIAQFLRRDPAKMGQVPYGENEGQEQRLDSGIEGFSFKEATLTRQFWMVFVMIFCFGFSYVVNAVHIVPHATDLGISAASAANVLATISGTFLLGGIVMGSVADRIGNRQTLIICFILMTAALFWLLAAREAWMLYLFAAVLGFGGGGAGMLESTLPAELFGMRSHGLILGVISVGFTIGAAVGPFITGYIFDVSGSYQPAFLINAVVGVVGLILAATLRPTKRLGGRI
ncbi:MFS transporter [Chloroflexota bacterium]